MIEFKPRMWTLMGVSAMALVGVTACRPDGEAGTKADVATPGAVAVASGAGGEGEGEGAKTAGGAVAGASAGGESGEAGAATAYDSVPEAARLGLRVAHLSGFLHVGRKAFDAGQAEEASILISQGILEVYDPHGAALAAAFPTLKPAYLAVTQAIDQGKPKAEVTAAFNRAIQVTQATLSKSGAGKADLLQGLLGIAAGLYSGVVTPEGNDPTEYQHAYGAVLATKATFDAGRGQLSAKNSERTMQLSRDMDGVLALFPAVTMPDTPAKVADMTAAVSRCQLALSGIR